MFLKRPIYDPERERELQLNFLLSLTTQQRFEMMERRGRTIMRALIESGHLKSCETVKRPLK
jgi:hypothetical protein